MIPDTSNFQDKFHNLKPIKRCSLMGPRGSLHMAILHKNATTTAAKIWLTAGQHPSRAHTKQLHVIIRMLHDVMEKEHPKSRNSSLYIYIYIYLYIYI